MDGGLGAELDIRRIPAIKDHFPSRALPAASHEMIFDAFAREIDPDGHHSTGVAARTALTFKYKELDCSMHPGQDFNPSESPRQNFIEIAARFPSSSSLLFTVSHEGAVSRLLARLGIGDAKIGEPTIDEKFHFSAEPEDHQQMRTIFNRPDFKASVALPSDVECSLKREDGNATLRYRISGTVGNVATLNGHLRAFADIVDGLIEVGEI